MNEEAGFIAALVAEPSDRTAALVFADWLDERGDPRGPMLRIDAVRALLAPKYESPFPRLRAAIETGKGVKKAGEMYALIGETAVPELVSFLTHETPIVRLRAVQVLSRMGEKAKSAVPALLDLVKNSNTEDVRARREAVRLLGALRMKEAAKDEYAKGLDSADAAERLTAVEAMVKMGLRTKSAGSALCKALTDESDGVRRAAAQHFRYIAAPSMPFAVEPLRKALSDKDAEIRTFAAIALGKIGPKATAAVPDLLRLLKDATAKEERVRLFEVLVQFGAGVPEVLEMILAALRDPDLRQLALGTLSKLPTLPASATPAILELVRRPKGGDGTWDAQCIYTGLPALARIVPRPPELLEELRAHLATDRAHVAARVLGEIDPPAAHLLPDLLAALHRLGKGNSSGAHEIAQAIGKIGGEGILALAKLLDRAPTKDDPLPAAAAYGLARAGAAVRPALPELLAQLKRLRGQNAGYNQTYDVINALVAIGADAAGAVPDLVGMFLEGDNQHYSSYSLCQTLQSFGPAVLPFVPQLTEALRQPPGRRSLHESIVRLIIALIPHGCDALPIFRDVLRQALASYETLVGSSGYFPWWPVAVEAINGLAKLGPAAEAAVPDIVLVDQTYGTLFRRQPILAAYGAIGGAAIPHIRAALSHPSPEVRLAAVEALGATGDKSMETRDALRALGNDSNEQTRAQVASLLQKM